MQLRELCNDFVPKQLQDWGLKLALADLVERVGKRSGMSCKFHCPEEIPKLIDPVQLHIFRIMQEWINNVEKYASASALDVQMNYGGGTLKFIVQDNGKGFEPQSPAVPNSSEGGRGLANLKERVELIRCYFAAVLSIDSQPGAGSRLMLEVNL